MARIRSIKPEFFEDELLGSLPREVRLLYPALWCYADDHGRFRANPAGVKGFAFPFDADISVDDVRKLLDSLARVGRIVLYDSGGQKYGAVVRWTQHQKVDHPGTPRCPKPPSDLVRKATALLNSDPPVEVEEAHQCVESNPREERRNDSRDSRETVATTSRDSRDGLAPDRIRSDPKGSEGRGGEREGRPTAPEPPPPNPPAPEPGPAAAAPPPSVGPSPASLASSLAQRLHEDPGVTLKVVNELLAEGVDATWVEDRTRATSGGVGAWSWKRTALAAWHEEHPRKATIGRPEKGPASPEFNPERMAERERNNAKSDALAAEFEASGYTSRLAWAADRKAGELRTGDAAARRGFEMGRGAFDAPSDADTTTAACERERRAPATCRRVISTPSPPATMPLAPT